MISSSKSEARAHLYQIGETVTFDPRNGNRRNPLGEFSVLAQMPPSGDEFQYRIKSAKESHQRVVTEHQLTRAPRGLI